ncbi:MAG: LPXTG cell wall anchor domain-containing protein [Lachnospiraceae bacterium]|nr:LPXTG cell wall anchor domain-containing protein [Lachnospiraceae bacterium]
MKKHPFVSKKACAILTAASLLFSPASAGVSPLSPPGPLFAFAGEALTEQEGISPGQAITDEPAADVPETEPAPAVPDEPVPEPAETDSQPMETDPQLAETDPQLAETDPRPAETDPQPAETDPQPAETDPQPAETDPQPMETDPQPAETDVPPEAVSAGQADDADSETGTEAVSEAASETGQAESLTETEPSTESAMESATETVSETVTETESETETEEPETESEEDHTHIILFEAQAGVTFIMKDDRLSYQEGEQVTFDVITDEAHDLDQIRARQVLVLSAEETSGTAGLGSGSIGAGAGAGSSTDSGALTLIEGAEVPLARSGSAPDPVPEETAAGTGTETTDTFSFVMPDEDVLLMAAATLAAPSSTDVELEYGGIKNIPQSWTPDGMEWANGRTSIGYSRYRTVTMPDGKTRVCYCLEPVLGADDAGSYTARRITGSPLLKKALFYCYGGPGWNGGGLKDVLSDCSSNDEYYVASHFALALIYLGKNGKWNKVISDGAEYDAMNARGEAQISAAVAALRDLPEPTAELSTTQVSGTYDAASGFAVTQSVTYTSSIPGNTLKVALPEGVFLVSSSGEFSPGQSAVISPGDSFYLKKKDYSSAHTQELTLTAAVATDFEAYLINVGADRQNMGFSYVADKTFTLQVGWPDLLTSLQVIKIDSVTGTSSPVNGHYALDGTVFGIYADEERSQLLEQVTISGGSARSSESFVIGTTYYIAEIRENPEYQKNTAVYPVTAGAGGLAGVTCPNVPKGFGISVCKKDAETGEGAPPTSALRFAGARFAVYADEACQTRAADLNGQVLADLVTGEDGTASTPATLPVGDYWVRELEPPTGYLLSSEIRHVSAQDAKAAVISQNPAITLTFPQQIIRGNAALIKIKNDKDQSVRPAAGIRFRFTYVQDPSVSFTVCDAGENLIETDAEGYASTQSSAYPRGTLIYGEWRITEENPPEGFSPIDPFTIMVDSDGRTYRFSANDRHIYAALLIEKRDANTGSLLPLPGVAFRIFKEGADEALSLFDPASRTYQSIWVTDEDGMVQLPDTIPYGSYFLEEDPATLPEGYLVMERRSFSVTESSADPASPLVITADEPPQTGNITVKKTDAGTGKPLEGFTFLISAADDITDMTGAVRPGENADGEPVSLKAGTIVDRITTGPDGMAVSKDLFPGVYTVEEVSGTNGYAILTEKKTVELKPDRTAALEGQGSGAETAFENRPTTLKIFKKASGGNQPLEGVSFRIKAVSGSAAGDAAAGWGEQVCMTDASGQILVEKLPAGVTYEVQEIATLPGYNPDPNTVTFSVDEKGLIDGAWCRELTFTNVPNVLSISKQDITGGEEIPGATLEIRADDGTVIEQWTSTDTPHIITAIPAGNYTLTETLPAPGYTTAESIRFTVTDQLTVQRVTMKDDFTKVQISKADITDGQPLEGATLIITDSAGTELARWITTREPYYIEKLPVGSYTLTEISAPKGYEVAESVTFEVKDHGEIQKVTMYDHPAQPDIPGKKKPKTPKAKKAAVSKASTPVSQPSVAKAPKTGDTTNIILPALAALLSLIMIAYIVLHFIRKKREI